MLADYDFQPPDWQASGLSLYAKTAADVERALARSQRTTDDLMALLSPAARPYLETMAQLSHQLTVQRFGRTQQLFAPLYVSNACANECDYCGFSMSNRVRRKVLTAAELAMEVAFLKRQGFEHLLLVAGEAPRVAGVDYFERALQQLGPEVAQISLEVQPMSTDDYRRLHRPGCMRCWCTRKPIIGRPTISTIPAATRPTTTTVWRHWRGRALPVYTVWVWACCSGWPIGDWTA